MASNPVELNIPAEQGGGLITCVSHALDMHTERRSCDQESSGGWHRFPVLATVCVAVLIATSPAAAEDPTFQQKTTSPAAPKEPTFQEKFYIANLREDAGIDSAVRTVKASGDETKYKIIKGDDSGVFGIDEELGAIILKKELDYESVKKYTLTVEARIGENTDLALVTVNVQDVEDATIAERIRSTNPMTAVLFSG